jgi:hypothetical protein
VDPPARGRGVDQRDHFGARIHDGHPGEAREGQYRVGPLAERMSSLQIWSVKICDPLMTMDRWVHRIGSCGHKLLAFASGWTPLISEVPLSGLVGRTQTCDLSRVKAFQTNFASWRFPTNQALTRRFSDHPRPPAFIASGPPLNACLVMGLASTETFDLTPQTWCLRQTTVCGHEGRLNHLSQGHICRVVRRDIWMQLPYPHQ